MCCVSTSVFTVNSTLRIFIFFLLSPASTLLEEINNNIRYTTQSECFQLLLTPNLKRLKLAARNTDIKEVATLLHLTSIKCSSVSNILQ